MYLYIASLADGVKDLSVVKSFSYLVAGELELCVDFIFKFQYVC
jgi:hypothetical protein